MTSACVTGSSEASNPTERLASALGKLFRELMKEGRKEAMKSGLSMPQAMALRGLAEMGPTPTTFWAEGLGFSPSAVSEMVDGLVKKGYAVRTHDAQDRRKVMISLSPKGQRFTRETQRRLKLFWEERSRLLTSVQVDAAAETIAALANEPGTGTRGMLGVPHIPRARPREVTRSRGRHMVTPAGGR